MTDAQGPRTHAFEALYRDEFAFVWTTARRLGVTPAIHEDVVQDVFLTAYRRLDQLRFEVSARAWLYGVTRRVAARYRRTASRTARRVTAVADARQGPAPAPQERLIAAQQLERGLAQLGGGTRAAFEMSEVLGMSGPEIAAELGLPVATVYSRIRLAREQLVRALQGPQGLERGLAAVRDDEAPAPASMQRCWLVILPGLSAKTGGVGVGAWAAATVLAIAGAAAVVGSSRAAPAPALVEAAPVAARAPRSTPVAAPAEAPPVIEAPRPVQRPVAAPEEDRLGAEVALLDRARDELGRDPAAALALLAEHARRFPAGALADVRGAVEAEALCLQGRAAEAEARAAKLQADHPNSAAARRFADFSCDR
jgi:RNA polymerase sigma factor (sigma-70 family)